MDTPVTNMAAHGLDRDARGRLLRSSVTRYPKLRGSKRDRPEDYASPRAFTRHVLRQELQRRPGLPEIVSIEDEEVIGRHQLRPIQFKRFRSKSNDDGGRRPADGFRITFAAPVRG